ncbi:hypothetical protein F5146DRAFT_1147362 [Armillaria mellea]|nr:hypothetical protein F5146DRAFT_1147362 [Armillaria mellea]
MSKIWPASQLCEGAVSSKVPISRGRRLAASNNDTSISKVRKGGIALRRRISIRRVRHHSAFVAVFREVPSRRSVSGEYLLDTRVDRAKHCVYYMYCRPVSKAKNSEVRALRRATAPPPPVKYARLTIFIRGASISTLIVRVVILRGPIMYINVQVAHLCAVFVPLRAKHSFDYMNQRPAGKARFSRAMPCGEHDIVRDDHGVSHGIDYIDRRLVSKQRQQRKLFEVMHSFEYLYRRPVNKAGASRRVKATFFDASKNTIAETAARVIRSRAWLRVSVSTSREQGLIFRDRRLAATRNKGCITRPCMALSVNFVEVESSQRANIIASVGADRSKGRGNQIHIEINGRKGTRPKQKTKQESRINAVRPLVIIR